MTKWTLGIIGGSGLYEIDGLEDKREERVQTLWGEPSDTLVRGRVGPVDLVFLPRHGKGHRLTPSSVPYRANIAALKAAGVTDILSISACGSLKEQYVPGQFVAVDQFIDRTVARESTFFGPGMVAHVSMARPVCSRLSALAADAAEGAGAVMHRGGTYLAMEGPQFSSLAESRLYRQWGCDVIGMTAMPEAKLAREAELPYALLAMVTDWDSWRDNEATVDVAEIVAQMQKNSELAKKALVAFCKGLPKKRNPSPIDRTLDDAVITAPAHHDKELMAKLDAVAGRLFRAR